MSSTAIRNKLYDYIRVADDKKLYAIYNLLEDEIEQTNEWWKDKKFINELDRRYHAMENTSDKGITVNELEQAITKRRLKKYGK
jgi:hypothetical protein